MIAVLVSVLVLALDDNGLDNISTRFGDKAQCHLRDDIVRAARHNVSARSFCLSMWLFLRLNETD